MPPATFLPMRMAGRVLAEPGGEHEQRYTPVGCRELRGRDRWASAARGGGSLLSPLQCTGGFRLLKMQDAARSCNSPRA